MGKSGLLERAKLANQIQGFTIPDRSDAWKNDKGIYFPIFRKAQPSFFRVLHRITFSVTPCRRKAVPSEILQKIHMLFAGWEVRILKNCDRGLENAARGRSPRASFSSTRSQFFTIRTDPKPVNNLFIFFLSLKRLCFYSIHTRASVTVTVVRDRKIRTALRTNQIAEFVTVTAWKKKIPILCNQPC